MNDLTLAFLRFGKINDPKRLICHKQAARNRYQDAKSHAYSLQILNQMPHFKVAYFEMGLRIPTQQKHRNLSKHNQITSFCSHSAIPLRRQNQRFWEAQTIESEDYLFSLPKPRFYAIPPIASKERPFGLQKGQQFWSQCYSDRPSKYKYNQIAGEGLQLTKQSISRARSRCQGRVPLSSLELVRSVGTMMFFKKQQVILISALLIQLSLRVVLDFSFLWRMLTGWSSSASRRLCSMVLPMYLGFFFLTCFRISQKAQTFSSLGRIFLSTFWLLDLVVRQEMTWLITFDSTFFLGYLKREGLQLELASSCSSTGCYSSSILTAFSGLREEISASGVGSRQQAGRVQEKGQQESGKAEMQNGWIH